MSRYAWPRGPRGRRGRAAERLAWNAGRGIPRAVPGALPVQRSASAHPTAAHPAAAPSTAAPPTAGADLWQPLGPTGTLRGQTDGAPRVAGRVKDLAVSPDGTRVYAASALGGLWYSEDGGGHWRAVGPYSSTPQADVAPGSFTLSCGALHVEFGASAAADEVFVATGEGMPRRTVTDKGVGAHYGGVGVLHATGPAAAGPVVAWTHEAQPAGTYPGLRGAGSFALARDPATPGRLAAATMRGVHLRDPGTGAWSLLASPTWPVPAADGTTGLVATDVVWVPRAAGGSRLWVAVAGAGQPDTLQGLWLSTDGGATFARVPLGGAKLTAARIGLAAAPGNPEVLYVLASGPARLWRVDGDGAVRPVGPLPKDPNVFAKQGHYDLALAVDPADPLRVVIGGAGVTSPDGEWDAALWRFRLAASPPASGRWPSGLAGWTSWTGSGVHADVHRIRWSTPTGATASSVLVGCDGGVFRSDHDGDPGTYAARADGMQATEAGFVACHPTSDGPVLAGVQDNGTQLRVGESAWRLVHGGDGGGVAFHPLQGGRWVHQFTKADWGDEAHAMGPVPPEGSRSGDDVKEDAGSSFYSAPAVLATGSGVALAIGTTRVWLATGWGTAAFDRRPAWVTLPSGTNPRGTSGGRTKDVLPAGAGGPGDGVRALRWASADRLYAVTKGAVHVLQRPAAGSPWTRTTIDKRDDASPQDHLVSGRLPFEGTLNDLAVHDPARADLGSFYLATSEPVQPLWWFDGGPPRPGEPKSRGTFWPCELPTAPGAGAAPRPRAYAVVVDPDHPEVVYVGTALGAYRGRLSFTGTTPGWTWTLLDDGLPEAPVQDLAIGSWPLPQGGRLRLLRAALQARGAWELQLDRPVEQLTYLRVHPWDTRRGWPVDLTDPLPPRPGAQDPEWALDWAAARNRDFRTPRGAPAPHPDGTAVGTLLWHASPDVRVRPSGTVPLPAPSSLPWRAAPSDRFALWALQTALHGIDPLVVPDGRWSGPFQRRLRALRVSLGLSDAVLVDAALWGDAAVQAAWWSAPWATSAGPPTEGDLVERLVGMATPRPKGPTAPAQSPASVAVPGTTATIEVCLHARGAVPVAPADVGVALLVLDLPADPTTWGAGPVPGLAAAVATLLLPSPGPGVLVAMQAALAPWRPVSLTVQRPAAPVWAGAPQVVEFDLARVGGVGARQLLLAVVAGAGTPDVRSEPGHLVPTDLRDLVLRSPHVAARSIEWA
ncbi:hypothetical protein EV189_2250 [Motilibacter rhizosphaerae]|uniref:Uncharacterized protein n=1 Tax=Motilibacter rhizosphaerae TaxID=598652 RepID=A0A4Q7NNL0_9ACTN|nr:hypothetical protein [Motilibacter rhizosphaerae]RZS86834.1 hypothetical protein EV189_2250 [Motilibacter rhizosphaerae]